MSSATFETYRHSGKFGFQGPLLALGAAVIVGFPLGYAYAYFMKWIPFIYLNFFAAIGYGALFGFMSGKLLKFSRVRNNAVASLTSFTAGVISLYFAWNGHFHATFEGAPIFCFPNEMIAGMRQLYDQGSWGMHDGSPVTGIPLAIVWVVEACIIVGLATAIGYGMVSKVPYCETSQCWLDQVKTINTLAPFTEPAHLAALKAGDLGPLTQAKPRIPDGIEWARITLKHSPNCAVFHTVSLQNVSLSYDKKGNPKTRARDLTRDLILPPEMFPLITKFEHFAGHAEAPAPNPETSSAVEG
jgi:uncharacterized membrane protein (Fun14 family)